VAILNANRGLDIFLTIVIAIVIIVGTYFLARLVIRDMKKAIDERNLLIEGIISKGDMNSVISSYISRIGPGTRFSLIYVDLDKFDDLAEAFGNKEARKILENIAKRFKKILPGSAKISRYHGDEFLIFLNNQYNQNAAAEYGFKLLDELRNKTKVQGTTEIDLTGSVAVCHYPMHGKNIKLLVESLKIAIYQAKKLGGNTLKIYSDEFAQDSETVEYFYQIKHAIEKREFQLYYMPIINQKDKTIYGYEALLRWNHPTLGVLAPHKFINIMEQTGDIHWVGNWGLESIIKASYELKALNPMYSNVKLSINLSPKQLLNEKIVLEFSKTIKRLKGDPNQIILEVGEFTLFEKQEQIFENLVKLSHLGFSIAVDGFSIDLATINRLDKINIDMEKICYKPLDPEETNEKRYLEILLNYVKENNKLIVVEGVENKDAVESMLKYGIELYQGYYFTQPIPFIEIQEFTRMFLER